MFKLTKNKCIFELEILSFMRKQISSIQNPKIKKLIQLQEKSRVRKKEGLFIVEGVKEISLALQGNYSIVTLFSCPQLISEDQFTAFKDLDCEHIEIPADVYKKIAYRTSTEGLIGILKTKSHDLFSFEFTKKNFLVLVAESLEKPGNIGAILRTADAANIDAVFIANPKTDLYNPNIVRSSVGCIFTNKIVIGTSADIIAFLQKHNSTIYAATLQSSKAYHLEDYTSASAIVVGTEATGLEESWRKAAKQNIHIPMEGYIDSMNVSVAAGILIFEAKRQRNFN
jgi:TrmH family RNA methyltransferase